jgi:2-methylfumaryl-CoA isomerase
MYQLLKGLRVVEGASFVAGPTCGLYLAQYGAEVIRFDSIGGGPDFNRWPLSPKGPSFYWEGLNKGKKSVALNLSSPEGRALAVAIACAPGDNAGLFVTNYPAEGFLSYEKLKAARADIICARVMGWADAQPGLDYTINSAVGVPYMTGPVGSDAPVNHVFPAWDFLTGALAAFSLIAAERDRRTSGQGREIRLPLADVAASSLAHMGQLAEVMFSGHDRPKLGNSIFGAFGRDFATRDGKRVMIAAITPRQWLGLCSTLGVTEQVTALEAEIGVSLTADEGLRFTHQDRLFPIIEGGMARQDLAALAPEFDKVGVCWGPYQTLREAVTTDARLFTANPMFSPVTHPSGETYPTPGAAATMQPDQRAPATAAPKLGQHTEEVLSGVLGLPSAEISRLFDAGVAAPAV